MRHIEQFLLRTSSIPVRNLSVCLLSMEQVEDLSSERCHTCTPTDVDHLSFGRVDMEFTVRTGDRHLITRFSSEYIRRTYTRIYVHPSVVSAIPRWRRDTDGQHDNVSFCWVVGHGVGSEEWLVILHD